MTIDILTLGNAVVDLLVTLDDTNPACRVDPTTHELCVKAGEKILASHVGFAVGGGACRVAISLSRLGNKATILAEIGNDEFAKRIEQTLKHEGVDISRLKKTTATTSFTAGLNFQKERTLFIHLADGSHAFDFSSLSPKWIYAASLGNPWQEAYQQVVDLKRETGSQIAFNPGPSQLQEERVTYQPLLSVTDVLFINKQEAQAMTGAKAQTDDAKKLLQTVQGMGPGIVVMTDGRNGSYTINAEGECLQMAMHPSTVVERTGAGDAYAAGFLGALLDGLSCQDGMLWGTLNASAVVEEIGGLTGLLTKEKLKDMLQKGDIPKVEVL